MFLNPLSKVEKNKSATNPTMSEWVNPDIFEFDDVATSCPVSNRTINRSTWRHKVQASFSMALQASFSMAHAPETFYCRGALGTIVNPNTGCVWTGGFNLNTLRVDGESFESEKIG